MEQLTTGTPDNLYGLDIETACAVVGCTDKECRHPLDHNRSKITKIAVTNDADDEAVFDTVEEFTAWLAERPAAVFTAHSGKFDFGKLNNKQLTKRWVHDSNLLAFVSTEKIPEDWLANYEQQRRAHNLLRNGMKHREAKMHSLKTLAPYFLGVAAFWEPETGHDDREYVLTDARYTLRLTRLFLDRLPTSALDFYSKKFLPYTKMLMDMEIKGIKLDVEETTKAWGESSEKMLVLEQQIQEQWAEHFKAWRQLQVQQVETKYAPAAALSEKKAAQRQRNKEKALAKIEGLNLNSPTQLKWLLSERLGLDVTNFFGNESTDKETLVRLSNQCKEVGTLIQHRQEKKLLTSFYPEYMDYQYKGRIHGTFNPSNARTGRLSSSNPNMQQCPGALHRLFVADHEDWVLITKDLGAIEPTVLAYYSEDPVLCNLMIEGGGLFHGMTAVAAFNLPCGPEQVKAEYPTLRAVAKTIGLAVLYGAGANRVLMELEENGIPGANKAMANRIVNGIRELYAGVWKFKLQLDKELTAGATIHNLLGRPFKITNRDDVYMKGLNTLIQGSASDHMLDSAYRIKEKYYITPSLLVHDEVVYSVPAEMAELAEPDINRVLTDRALPTQFGNIPIRTDGKVSYRWEK